MEVAVMESLLESILERPFAALFGSLGLTCQLAWPVFSTRHLMLAVQFGIGATYGLQYALLDAWSGAGICSIGATQTVIAFFAGDKPWLRKLGLIFLPVVGAVSYFTWSGYASLFALAACSLVMLGRLQKDTIRLRMFLLAASPFGISYDLSVGAMPALCGAISSAIVAAVMLARELRKRNEAAYLPA
jgi:hypothetical protein